MLNTLGRNFHLCFTKTKPPPSESPPSIPHHHSRPSFLIKNFNSLFDNQTRPNHSHSRDSNSNSSPADTPDFATAMASRRFFFSSPGRSNSIIDSSLTSSSTSSVTDPHIGEELIHMMKRAMPETEDSVGGVAIHTYSPDPYCDFRGSMEEMVEAQGLQDVRESWEQLHELLKCYLTLNPKCTHKVIYAAFADLLVSLMSNVI